MKKSVLSLILTILVVSKLTFAGNYTWNPASGTSAKNKANWRTSCGTSGTVFPTSSDTLVFNGSCSNANCTLDTTFNLAKINVRSNYSGTITAGSGITLTFVNGAFSGGTFNGGSIPISFAETVRINGGTFTSTSDVLTLTLDNFAFTSGTFNHNNGTVVFKRASTTTTLVSGTANNSTTFTLYKAEFAAASQNSQFNIRNMKMEIENELKMSGTYQLFLNTNTSSTVEIHGNIVNTNTNSTGGGTVLLLINGTGTQSISTTHTSGDIGKFPNVTINKSSGTLSLSGFITLGGTTTWKYTAGTVNVGTSTVVCSYNNTLYNNSSGAMTFHHLQLYGRGDNHTITGKVTVTDTLKTALSGGCIIDGDTLEVQGNIRWSNSSASSDCNAVLKFTGSNEQSISGIAVLPLSKVMVNKTAGSVSLNKGIDIESALALITGYISSSSTNLVAIKHGATVSGASSNSFIDGPVKKIGNASFIFPLGGESSFKPLSITAPSSSTDAFTAEYFPAIQKHGFAKDTLTYLSSCEYWNVDRTTGSSNI